MAAASEEMERVSSSATESSSRKGLSAKSLPEDRRLPLQGVGLCALRVESTGGEVDAFLGGGGVLEEVHLLLELLTMLGVGGTQTCGLLLQFRGGGGGFVPKLGRDGGGEAPELESPVAMGSAADGTRGGPSRGARRPSGRAWPEVGKRKQGIRWETGIGPIVSRLIP